MIKGCFGLMLLLLLSCSHQQDELPEGIIKPEKMQNVFWDYLRAGAYTNEYIKKDSSRSDTLVNLALQQKIFSFYKITREDFYKSYRYYTDQPVLMQKIIDSMVARQHRSKSFSGPKEINVYE